MTQCIAIAIWILGLFVFWAGTYSISYAADYYIVRGGDMLYRVPRSAQKKFLGSNFAQDTKRDMVNASWYGPRFHGRRMASGKTFNMFEIFVAHEKLPLGTCVRIENPENGRTVQAPVSDRGPYVPGRKLDLSCFTMGILGGIEDGVIPVKYKVIPGARWCKPFTKEVDRDDVTLALARCREEKSARKN